MPNNQMSENDFNVINRVVNMDPRYFVGVKTTKIYCYPWCKAPSPKPENTLRFETREVAEKAGFRACRSCFPGIPFGHWEDHKEYVVLMTPTDFNFDEILVYLDRSSNECLHHIRSNKIFKVISVQQTPLLIIIEKVNKKTLKISFGNGNRIKKSIRVEAARYVWDWFDLGRDLNPFYQLAERDHLLKNAVSNYYGLRIVGVQDLFEALCWAIIGQQINLTFAYMLKRSFVENFGTSIQHGDNTYWFFPTPESIASLTPKNITNLKFTQKKAEYIIEIAKKMCSGELSKQKLKAIDNSNEVKGTLTKIRGIGNWTANYVMMRCLRIPSAFPIEDVGLQNAIKQILKLDQKPSLDEIKSLGNQWAGWEAYATFYLWHSL
jgi:DNA-3-methyladenine glycosylase II